MVAILEAIEKGQIKRVKPTIVVSNRSDAQGLKLATQKFGVSTHILSKDHHEDHSSELMQVLEKYDVHPMTGVICLAGFMKILGPILVDRYRMRILNIHPSLLPSFPGLHSQRQALEYGAKISGCTVHLVDDGVDTGPILMQKAVPVFDNDTEVSLTKRILKAEHILYPAALRLFSEGQLKLVGRRISMKDMKVQKLN